MNSHCLIFRTGVVGRPDRRERASNQDFKLGARVGGATGGTTGRLASVNAHATNHGRWKRRNTDLHFSSLRGRRHAWPR